MIRLAVLITCHNRRDQTLACLSALRAQINNRDYNVTTYVVDDGCTDGTAAAIAHHPNIKILHGDGNLFWNGGMHVAFAAAMKDGYDGYVWLNDDVVLDPDALFRFLEADKRVRALAGQPVIIVGSTRDQQTHEVTYGGLARVSWLTPLKFRQVQPHEIEIEIETMNGNCVFISNETAGIVGNLDPAFLHSWGDMDYGLRARAAGVRIWLISGTIGSCRRNAASQSWYASGIGFRERWRRMNSHRGPNWPSWKRFARRHGGPLWFIYFLLAYRHLIWP